MTSDPEKTSQLEKIGAKVISVDMENEQELATVCIGATCVGSALAGLKDVVIDTQKKRLNAAIKALVPSFIPFDYSLDFTRFQDGKNRKLDLRRELHKYLDSKSFYTTTVLKGAFMDLLTNEIPMIIFNKNPVLYWGNADHKIGFTTIADTAIFLQRFGFGHFKQLLSKQVPCFETVESASPRLFLQRSLLLHPVAT